MTKRKSVLKYMNEVTAQSMIKILSSCTSSVAIDQEIRLATVPVRGRRLEDSASCVACVADVSADVAFFEALRARTANPPDATLQMTQTYDRLQDCATRCKTLVLRNTSQTAFVKTNQGCVINTDLAAQWAASVSAEFNTSFYSNTDVASAILGATRASRKDKTKVNYLTRTTSRLTAELATRIMSLVAVDQRISVTGAAIADRVHQDVLVVAISNLLADQKIHDDVLSETEWESFESIYQNSATIGPLGNQIGLVLGSLSTLVNTTLGAVIIAVFSILGALVIAFFVLVIVRSRRGA